MSLNHKISNITGINIEFLLIISGVSLYWFHFLSEQQFMVTSIILTCFVLALYDVILKQILLFDPIDDYYKLIINNAITIITIDFLINFIKNSSNPKLNFIHYFNLGISCVFYDTIIFKLYNYNSMCSDRLRSISKTIVRLSTIHILSNFLDSNLYDKDWFDLAFGQMFNFALFDVAFSK